MLTRTVTDQAMAAAKEPGNFNAIRRLFDATDRSNFRWELVDLVFSHLRPQQMETSPTNGGGASNETEWVTALARTASLCAADGMSIILSFTPESQRARLVRTILDHFDNLTHWIGLLVQEGISRTPSHLIRLDDPSLQCRALLYMLDYKYENGILGSEVKKSDQMIHFSVAAWTAKVPIVNDVYFNIEPDARCPVIHLFSRLLFIDETRQEIFDLLHAPGKKFKRLRAAVVEATVSRCRSLGDIIRSEMEGQFAARISAGGLRPPASGSLSMPRIAFKYFERLLRIARQLSLHSGMRNMFIRSTFLQDFVRGLQTWVVKKTDRQGDREDRRHAFQILEMVKSFVDTADIVNDPSLSSGGFWRNSAEASLQVVHGGYVSVVLEGMESTLPHDEESRDVLTGCLEWLRDACSQHPSLVRPVWSDLVDRLGETLWHAPTFPHPEWNMRLKETVLDVAAALHLPQERSFTLCDNLDVCIRQLLLTRFTLF